MTPRAWIVAIAPALVWSAAARAAELTFDRYHPYDEMTAWLAEIAERHPDLVRLESAGKSRMGRDLWVVTITELATGAPETKPAVYIDGAHHGNEVASSEVPLYLMRFLLSGREEFQVVRRLLETRTFYLMPRVNPDSAEWCYRGVEVRGNLRLVDKDRDGRVDEDGPNDVDGDGIALTMAIPDPKGSHVFDEGTGRPVRARRGSSGQRYRIAQEGSDEDGDGKVDEDGPDEGADLNRNYPDPAGYYGALTEERLEEPESQAVAKFLREHPNISNVQSFHTYGGILFRPFGGLPDSYIPDEDLAVYDRMGENFTRYTGNNPYGRPYGPMVTIKGALLDYAYAELGAYAVTAELWRPPGEDTRKKESWSGGLEGIVGPAAERAWRDFNEKELGGKAYVAWHDFADHPQHGKIRIGGWDPFFKRNPPVSHLEDVCRTATHFALYQTLMTPRLVVKDFAVERGDSGALLVRFTLENEGVFPTSAEILRQMGRSEPIELELAAGGHSMRRESFEVLAGEASRTFSWTLDEVPAGELVLAVRSAKGGTFELPLSGLEGH